MKNSVTFIANTPDNLHCTPTCYMMIAKYFDPSFNIPMDEWAVICGFEPGKGTWANGGLLWFVEHGYDVKHMEDFDDERFVNEGGEYLIALHGQETGEWMIKHTNIAAEIERIKKLREHSSIYSRAIPTINDMKHLLDEGYLLRIAVNWRALHDKPGYDGHSIVAYGYDNDYMYVHDPGLPPQESLALAWDKLDRISADPTIQNREVDAVRLR